MQEFFASAEREEKVVFSKEEFVEKISDEYKLSWLVPNAQKNEMEPIVMFLNEGAESEIRYPFEGEEFGYVLEGKIKIVTETTEYKAKKGDAFYIDGKRQHTVRNNGKTIAKIMWVTTPSNF